MQRIFMELKFKTLDLLQECSNWFNELGGLFKILTISSVSLLLLFGTIQINPIKQKLINVLPNKIVEIIYTKDMVQKEIYDSLRNKPQKNLEDKQREPNTKIQENETAKFNYGIIIGLKLPNTLQNPPNSKPSYPGLLIIPHFDNLYVGNTGNTTNTNSNSSRTNQQSKVNKPISDVADNPIISKPSDSDNSNQQVSDNNNVMSDAERKKRSDEVLKGLASGKDRDSINKEVEDIVSKFIEQNRK